MKALTISALILALGSFAQAGQEGYGTTAPVSDAELTYKALNVQPDPFSEFEHWWSTKSVGGLTCTESREKYPTAPPTYSCDVDPSQPQDNEAIYNALDVKAISLTPPGAVGVGAYKKSAGNLVCTVRHVVSPRAPYNYACVLQ